MENTQIIEKFIIALQRGHNKFQFINVLLETLGIQISNDQLIKLQEEIGASDMFESRLSDSLVLEGDGLCIRIKDNV